MSTYFLDYGKGSDSHDGRDNTGLALATATWTESTERLTQSGAFTAYTHTDGDCIYIDGGTGATVGLYQILSKVDNDTVELASSPDVPEAASADDLASGDLSTGDLSSSDGPWKTFDKAFQTQTAGDKIYAAGGTDYTDSTIPTLQSGHLGTDSSPIVIEGYSSKPGDGGMATIDAENARDYCITAEASLALYMVFKNITCERANNICFDFGFGGDYLTLKNCRASNGTNYGVVGDNWVTLESCVLDNNGSNSVDTGADCDANVFFLGCVAYNNYIGLASLAGGGIAYECLCYNNSATDIALASASTYAVLGCTIDGDGGSKTGIDFGSTGTVRACINNIVIDCDGTAAIDCSSNDIGELGAFRNNLLALNSTNYSNCATYSDEVTATPTFVNRAGDDYRVASGDTAATAAGFDAAQASGYSSQCDLGALQKEVVASGGGSWINRGILTGGRL